LRRKEYSLKSLLVKAQKGLVSLSSCLSLRRKVVQVEGYIRLFLGKAQVKYRMYRVETHAGVLIEIHFLSSRVPLGEVVKVLQLGLERMGLPANLKVKYEVYSSLMNYYGYGGKGFGTYK